ATRAMAESPERRPGHARGPGGIAKFQPIATGIKKIQSPPGEAPLLPMIQVLDPDLPLPKHLTCPDEGLWAHRERVMHLRILDKGVIHRRGTLAEQDMVLTGGETRHPGIAKPAHRGETEQVPVEGLRLLQVVDGNGPVRDAFDVQETHRILLLVTATHRPACAPPLARPARGAPPGPRPATPGAQ